MVTTVQLNDDDSWAEATCDSPGDEGERAVETVELNVG